MDNHVILSPVPACFVPSRMIPCLILYGYLFNNNMDTEAVSLDPATQKVFALEERLTSLVECPICMQPFTDPRMLSCQHSFCLNCLSDHAKSSTLENIFACPVCRQENVTPQGGVEAIAKNIVINKLSDVVELKSLSVQVVSGMSCSPNGCEAKSENFHSSSQLMTGHPVIANQADHLKQHNMVSHCHRHKNNVIDLYCKTCDTIGCSTCFFLEHRDHTCCDISSQRDQMMTDLQELLGEANTCLKLLTEASMSTTKMKVATKQDFISLRNELTYLAREHGYTNYLRKIKKDIIGAENKVDKTICAVEENHNFIRTALGNLKQHEPPTVHEAAGRLASIKQRLREVCSMQLDIYSWKYSLIRAKTRGMELEDSWSVKMNLDILEPGAKDVNTEMKRCDQVTAEVVTLEADYAVAGMVLQGGNLFILHKRCDLVYFLNIKENQRKLCSSYIHELVNPQHVACNQFRPDTLLVADHVLGDEKPDKLLQIHLSDFQVPLVLTHSLGETVRGLSCNSQNNIIMAAPVRNQIWKCTPKMVTKDFVKMGVNGRVLNGGKIIIPYQLDMDDPLVDPYDVQQCLILEAPDKTGYITISRKCEQIVWIRYDGTVIRAIDLAACDLVLDGDDLLLVVDGQKDEITVVNLQNDSQMVLPVKVQLRAPSRICLDGDRDLLFVVHQTESRRAQELMILTYNREELTPARQCGSNANHSLPKNPNDVGYDVIVRDKASLPHRLVQCSLRVTLPYIP